MTRVREKLFVLHNTTHCVPDSKQAFNSNPYYFIDDAIALCMIFIHGYRDEGLQSS